MNVIHPSKEGGDLGWAVHCVNIDWGVFALNAGLSKVLSRAMVLDWAC